MSVGSIEWHDEGRELTDEETIAGAAGDRPPSAASVR